MLTFNSQKKKLDDKKLNHHRTDEPFPVEVRVRNERCKNLIKKEALAADVLELAKTRI